MKYADFLVQTFLIILIYSLLVADNEGALAVLLFAIGPWQFLSAVSSIILTTRLRRPKAIYFSVALIYLVVLRILSWGNGFIEIADHREYYLVPIVLMLWYYWLTVQNVFGKD